MKNDDNLPLLLLEDNCREEKHLDYKQNNLLTANSTAQHKHESRPEIQTLRAIAIFSVLLFHIWKEYFPYGFLGVDLFFVISGFLMCQILSRKQPLKRTDILQFHERRLKRIVPVYLFVIAAIIALLFYIIAEIQFHQIVGEALSSMFFVSNFPPSAQTDYFDVRSRFYFFLHTWSLSVEIQFYLIVPFIFLFFDFLNRHFGEKANSTTNLIIVTAIILSFMHQLFLYSNINARYMSLSGRIWQFFCGFLAYRFGEKFTNLKKCANFFAKFAYFISFLLLLFILFVGFRQFGYFANQLNRLISIVLTSFIIAQTNLLPLVMSNWVLVALGDVSYSTYLVHWPLITCYRYLNMDEGRDVIGLRDGIILLILSIFIGFVVEKTSRHLLTHVKSWLSLLFIILFGYLACMVLLCRLERNAIQLKDSNGNIINRIDFKPFSLDLPEEFKRVPEVANVSYENRLQDYNQKMANTQIELKYCEDKQTPLSTNYNFSWSSYTRLERCFKRGNGTKNIVLIGNSHAMYAYIGISMVFSDLYKTLIVDTRPSCLATTLKFQQPERSLAERTECANYISEYMPKLTKWQEPIDILIAQFGLVDLPDYPLDKDPEKDELLQVLQTFYMNMSTIPRELLIIEDVGVLFKDPILQVFASKMKSGKNYTHIGDTRANILSRTPNNRKRMELLDCSNRCLKMKWVDYWCGPDDNAYCPAVDPETGLWYFIDKHHPSPIGSFKQAVYMRKQYEAFVKRKENNIE